MSCLQFTLADYNAIATEYSLPAEVITIIQALAKRFGTSIEKPVPRERRTSPFEPKDTNFKATVIEKKVGVELWMNEVRISLNKISDKNYETHCGLIVSKMLEIQNTPDSTESLRKIATTVFDIASTNRFFSEIYAKLYKSLSDVFPDVFAQILDDFIKGVSDRLRTIRYVGQNTNYDDFCNYNKENDKRKASAVFITNLTKVGLVPLATVQSLLLEIQEIIDGMMRENDKSNEVEEITENLYLLLTNQTDILREVYPLLQTRIQEIAERTKSKEFPSLSTRTIFKYSDMLDKIHLVK